MFRPGSRIFTTILLLLALLMPSGTAADGCLAAKHELLLAWRDSSRELTPEVAKAIKARLDACPDVVGAQTQRPACDPSAPSACAGIPVAKTCGFTSITTAEHPRASITAWHQAAGNNLPEYDEGPASATFHPTTGEITYGVNGAKWGLEASSSGAAIIWLHGVPIPAKGTAVAGCTKPDTRDLCWARANAHVIVEGVGGIAMESSFSNCQE